MWVWASPNHFRTLGQPLLAGRDFDPRDDADAPSVMIVSRTFARTMFPDRSPAEVVGQSVTSWRERLAMSAVFSAACIRSRSCRADG